MILKVKEHNLSKQQLNKYEMHLTDHVNCDLSPSLPPQARVHGRLCEHGGCLSSPAVGQVHQRGPDVRRPRLHALHPGHPRQGAARHEEGAQGLLRRQPQGFTRPGEGGQQQALQVRGGFLVSLFYA